MGQLYESALFSRRSDTHCDPTLCVAHKISYAEVREGAYADDQTMMILDHTVSMGVRILLLEGGTRNQHLRLAGSGSH